VNTWVPDRDERREERVRTVKDRVERGQYRVPAAEVADAVIEWYRRIDPPSQR